MHCHSTPHTGAGLQAVQYIGKNIGSGEITVKDHSWMTNRFDHSRNLTQALGNVTVCQVFR